MTLRLIGLLSVAMVFAAGCAAPAPTATPTTPPAAAATPTKAAPTPTAAPTATSTKRPLTKATFVSSSLSLSWTTIWLARALDLFRPEGLDVEYVQTGGAAKTIAALFQGDGQFGALNSTELINAIVAKVPVQAIATLTIGRTTQGVIRREVAERLGITEKTLLDERIRLLRGLTVAAPSEGAAQTWELRLLLAERGMDAGRDIDLVFLQSAARIPAVKQGAVDVLVDTVPNTGILLASGDAILLYNSAEAAARPGLKTLEITLAASKQYAAASPEVLEAAVRGVWRAERVIRDEKQRALNALYSLEFFKEIEPPAFELSFNLQYPILAHEPTLHAEEFQAALDFRNLTVPEGDRASLSFEEFGTNRFAEAAKKQLGF